MTKARLDGLLLFLLGCIVFVLAGSAWERASHASMADFKEYYYGARCLLQHSDPYQQAELFRVYQAERSDHESTPDSFLQVVTLYINLPTAFVLTVPFAMLPWSSAHVLWMIFTAASFILAAWLMWNFEAAKAPIISGGLICLFLIGSEMALEIGNAACIAASLCVIAVSCFIRERLVPAGILCFAISLAVKPHVAGMVLLYFLLANARYRKRALQTLAVTALLCLPVVLWVSHIAPNWIAELHANMETFSVHGGLGDPGPAGVDPRFHGAIQISLQTVFSIFRDRASFYNAATYAFCAPLFLVWAVATLRKRFSQESAWLGLATIAAISMLPIYHRLHDTRLLLLVFPAFAGVWSRGSRIKWLALLLTGAGIVMTDDVPLQILAIQSARLRGATTGLTSQFLTLMLARPVPLILLAMGVFYLWVYVRHTSVVTASGTAEGSELALTGVEMSESASA
jgi:hypothetical protein